MRSFRSMIWQQGMLPDAPTADTSGFPVKQAAPPSPRAAAQAGLARLAHLACLPAAEQRSEASGGLAPDGGGMALVCSTETSSCCASWDCRHASADVTATLSLLSHCCSNAVSPRQHASPCLGQHFLRGLVSDTGQPDPWKHDEKRWHTAAHHSRYTRSSFKA